MEQNVLTITTKQQFKEWLQQNHHTEKECWVCVKKGKPIDDEHFWYLDAVEEALCYGWIDSTNKLIQGQRMQRFTPRSKDSLWTELNKERVRRLIQLNRMTEYGLAVAPDLSENSYQMSEETERALKQARVYSKFKKFPPLYQRVRTYNVEFYFKRDQKAYQKALQHLIQQTKEGKCMANGMTMVDYYEQKNKCLSTYFSIMIESSFTTIVLL